MKKRKLLFLFFLMLLLLPMFVIITFGSNDAENMRPDDELENIEDMIIIDGIRHPDDISGNSGIIFLQDSFDEPEAADDVFKKSSKTIQPKTVTRKINHRKNREEYLRKLRNEDKKWHYTEHKIRKGENLWIIAEQYAIDHKMIIKANEIRDPDLLLTGSTLSVPNRKGISYLIKKSDTLTGISKEYGIEAEKIAAHNNIKKDLIFEGASIFLPDAEIKTVKKSESDRKDYSIAKRTENKDNKDKKIVKAEKEYYKSCKHNFNWPVKGEITSAFGERIDPITNRKKFHCGLDIKANLGTPVSAAADGKTIFSGWKKGYGRVVILKHDDGYITVYAHNKDNLVKTGDQVKEGDTVSLSGMSGAVTGAHLHFEIRKYLTPLNPLRFLN